MGFETFALAAISSMDVASYPRFANTARAVSISWVRRADAVRRGAAARFRFAILTLVRESPKLRNRNLPKRNRRLRTRSRPYTGGHDEPDRRRQPAPHRPAIRPGAASAAAARRLPARAGTAPLAASPPGRHRDAGALRGPGLAALVDRRRVRGGGRPQLGVSRVPGARDAPPCRRQEPRGRAGG